MRGLETAAKLANLVREIVGEGAMAVDDWADLSRSLRHVVHAIRSQAAARLYPEKFRLLGEIDPAFERALATLKVDVPQAETEARATYPPNCERCVFVPSLGLIRCPDCSVVALERRVSERRLLDEPGIGT